MFFHPSEFLIKINDTVNKSIRTHQSQLLHRFEQLKKKQIPPSANSSELGRKKKGWFGGQVIMNLQGQRCDLSTSQSTLHDSNCEHPAFYCGYRLQFLSFTMGHYGRSSMGYSWPGMSKVYIISAQSTPLRSLSPLVVASWIQGTHVLMSVFVWFYQRPWFKVCEYTSFNSRFNVQLFY